MDKLVSEKIDEMIEMFGGANLKKMEGVAHHFESKMLNNSLEKFLILISNS